MAKPIVFIVLGGPGCGKGTQCSLLVKTMNFFHLSAGELLRNEMKKGRENAKLIENILKEGKIVPSHITVGLLKSNMQELGWDRKFLIDGFPRNIENLEFWEKEMKEIIDFKKVLYFTCHENILKERILSRAKGNTLRNDDNEISFQKRMKTFYTDTYQVIDYYRNIGKVAEISAEDNINEIFKRTTEVVKSLLK